MTPGSERERLSILGFPVDAAGMDEFLADCERFLSGTAPRRIVTTNPLMLLAAGKNAALAQAIMSADMVVPDGVGLSLAALLHGEILVRVPGIELMERLCRLAAVKGWTLFLLGAAPGVADAASTSLRSRYPALKIIGTTHGYFTDGGEESIRAVSTARPDILFVALPTPMQDAWIHLNLPRLGAQLVMGVGGSFDVLSGRLRRAPTWMRAVGLEWLFRLIQEPRRLKRMLGLPVFLWKILADRRRA